MLSAVGINLDEQIAHAAPNIIKQIDNILAPITLADGETKGLVIIPDGHGSYLIVKTVFDEEAHNHMQNKGYDKVDELIKRIINSITE